MRLDARVLILTHGHESLDCLQVFAGRLVIEYVRDLGRVDARPATSLVDADHGDAHGPRTVANRQLHVLVVRFEVLLSQAMQHDHVDGVQNLRRNFFPFQKFQQRLDLLVALLLFGQLGFASG